MSHLPVSIEDMTAQFELYVLSYVAPFKLPMIALDNMKMLGRLHG